MFRKHNIAPLLMMAALLAQLGAFAQADDPQLKKEVHVVRPYDPTIPDAVKINLQPQIADTVGAKPTFAYSIAPRPLLSHFEPRPIAAAKMVAEPLPELKRWYVRLGFDSHISPLLELYHSSPRSKQWQYGGWARHRSTFGGLTLQNDERVDAKSTQSDVALFGKHIRNSKVLSANAFYRNRGYSYYGYNYADTLAAATADRQSLNSFGVSAGFSTVDTDSSTLRYSAQLGFEHLADAFGHGENKLSVVGGLDKYLSREQFGGDVAFVRYGRGDATAANTIFSLSPWINLLGRQWRVQVGFTFTLDANRGKSYRHFYPKAHLSYNIVAGYVIPYIEVDGQLDPAAYSHLLAENPWVQPGLDVWNASHKMVLRGGLKGKFSARVAYNVLAAYSIVDSMHFYVNQSVDASNPQANRFGVVYDNVRQTKVVGELTIAPMSRLDILLHGELLRYAMRELEHPWHKPGYRAFATVRYSLRDKVVANLQLDLQGKRPVASPSDGQPLMLEGNVCANLGLEYIYNRRASAFLNITNLTAHRHHYWYLYPTYRLGVQAGVSYTF